MKDNIYRENIIKGLKEYYLQSEKEEIIIVCIGTPKNIGDSLGPLIGTELSRLDINVKVYGTMVSPLHALNIEDKFKIIKNNHPNAFIIGIDAAIGDKEDIGNAFFKNSGIRPGHGVNKQLGSCSHVSILGIISDSQEDVLYDRIRMHLVSNLANKIINNLNGFFDEFNLFGNMDNVI